MPTPADISRNFHAAKFLAILAVTAGHYFDNSGLWVVAQIALFVFSFSSGYFTALRYPSVEDTASFWHAKIVRLAPPLLVINCFLLIVFLLIDRPGIVSLHTPLALLGMSGVYDWLGIRNQSAFGYGLWFLTILLIFYAVYPWLTTRLRRYGWPALLVAAAICLVGTWFASPPYALWQTVFGFVLGVFVQQREIRPARTPLLATLLACMVAFVLLNVIHFKNLNGLIVIALSLLMTLSLLCIRLPAWLNTATSPFQGAVLHVYVIHYYLFVPHDEIGRLVGFAGSLFLILSAALLLHRLSSLLDSRLFGKTQR